MGPLVPPTNFEKEPPPKKKRNPQVRKNIEKISPELFEEVLKDSKMNHLNKERAKAVFVDGLNYSETAQKFGSTRQNIEQVVGRVERKIIKFKKQTEVQLREIR